MVEQVASNIDELLQRYNQGDHQINNVNAVLHLSTDQPPTDLLPESSVNMIIRQTHRTP